MKRTLVVLYPGCIEREVILAAQLLDPTFPVEVATPDGGPLRGASGMRFLADLGYADIEPERYRVGLVPGGDFASVYEDPSIFDRLRAMHGAGALLGAICAGPFFLARAGLLRGREVAHGFDAAAREFLAGHFDGARWSDALLHADDAIVTARATAWLPFALEILHRVVGLTPERRRALERALG